MSRLRRIAQTNRIFFTTTNLHPNAPRLRPFEMDLILSRIHATQAHRKFVLIAYVVMPDHVHLLFLTNHEFLSKIMHHWKFQTGYVIQRHRSFSGHLWQARYFDFICRRPRDVYDKLRYIHKNPVAAKFVANPELWKWSSAAHYCGCPSNTLLPPDQINLHVQHVLLAGA